uniref:Transmembrane protein n=1 Tax=Aureoumbra lagunensis TaxID=44058 RepID=A0A7S3JVT5_9STRA|mmetsp:Transcript_19233/g.24959  ORF Transcript_19233/g.24959 Transcript_19233/m.24959 type:complete len:150 (+) Transcript_19233:85-534(+)
MSDKRGRSAPQHLTRRMRKIVEEQGHAAVMGMFAVVLIFICIPLFLVDDLLYVHTTEPEVKKRDSAIVSQTRAFRGEQSYRGFSSNTSRLKSLGGIATDDLTYTATVNISTSSSSSKGTQGETTIDEDDVGIIKPDLPAADRNGDELWR